MDIALQSLNTSSRHLVMPVPFLQGTSPPPFYSNPGGTVGGGLSQECMTLGRLFRTFFRINRHTKTTPSEPKNTLYA